MDKYFIWMIRRRYDLNHEEAMSLILSNPEWAYLVKMVAKRMLQLIRDKEGQL